MKVDIWSDIRCPFCYIGKHKFEKALAEFSNQEEIEVVWHSFELDPNLKTDTEISTNEYLSQTKGMPLQQVEQMGKQIRQSAQEIGLEMNLEKSIVANSFDAHRLLQYSKTKGKMNDMEEAMFKAHFTDGINIDDKNALVTIGVSVGLDEKEVEEVVHSSQFEQDVKRDKARAAQLGIRGVPFFVFNNKYAVSGAQPPSQFLEALKQSYAEFKKDEKPLILKNENSEGGACDVDGNCD